MKKAAIAIVEAAALRVLCVYCGHPQPAPETGSDLWEPWQLAEAASGHCGVAFSCISCDKDIRIKRALVVTVGP